MEEKNKISLYNSECAIMECLWASAPQTITQIEKYMEKETGWAAVLSRRDCELAVMREHWTELETNIARPMVLC